MTDDQFFTTPTQCLVGLLFFYFFLEFFTARSWKITIVIKMIVLTSGSNWKASRSSRITNSACGDDTRPNGGKHIQVYSVQTEYESYKLLFFGHLKIWLVENICAVFAEEGERFPSAQTGIKVDFLSIFR